MTFPVLPLALSANIDIQTANVEQNETGETRLARKIDEQGMPSCSNSEVIMRKSLTPLYARVQPLP